MDHKQSVLEHSNCWWPMCNNCCPGAQQLLVANVQQLLSWSTAIVGGQCATIAVLEHSNCWCPMCNNCCPGAQQLLVANVQQLFFFLSSLLQFLESHCFVRSWVSLCSILSLIASVALLMLSVSSLYRSLIFSLLPMCLYSPHVVM